MIKHAIKSEGIFAFYKGSLVPLMLNSPACSVRTLETCKFKPDSSSLDTGFGVWEHEEGYAKRRLVQDTLDAICSYLHSGVLNSQPLLQSFIAGGCGGSAMAMVATPMEHIRIRMQMQTAEAIAYTGSIGTSLCEHNQIHSLCT